MSLNTAHTPDGLLIYLGEQIVLFAKNVDIEFGGSNEPALKTGKHGTATLTTHRLIFINSKKNDTLQSFSFPFVAMSDLGLEQPVFGANYIRGTVTAQPNGNWTGQAKFKITFKSGGAVDFGQAIVRLAAFAKKFNPSAVIPPYMAPGPFHPAVPVAYQCHPSGYYGWQPPVHAFPSAPPANTVYMVDTPPPYSGIFPPQSQPYAAAANAPQPQDAKAAEAAQSAYYDPNRPQYAYVPPPAYYENPPTYEEATGKKKQ